MFEFIQNNTGWFSILAIIFTIVMGLVGFSANVNEANRKAQELTDEELYKLYADLQENYTGNNFPVDLGRVILRKTQEK